MNKIHKNVKAIGISTKNVVKQKNAINMIDDILRKYNVELVLEEDFAKEIGKKGLKHEEFIQKVKIVISVGGDGNFISTCRKFATSNIYIFGVHTGNLGFLTDVTLNECEQFFENFFNGNYRIEQPYMLEARFFDNKNIIKKIAFNDVVLMRKKVDSIAHIEAFLDERHFNSYFGDGVIVSSAMGSTAYNMSAGGAIIYPLCEVFSLTPICSHSLTQRPLILPRKFSVKFKSNDDVVVLIDGQDRMNLRDFMSVEVGLSNLKVNLIKQLNRDYFEVLKEKLRWGAQ